MCVYVVMTSRSVLQCSRWSFWALLHENWPSVFCIVSQSVVCVCVCVVSRRLCLTLNTVFCEVWLLTFLTFTALKTTRIWFSSISRHVEKWRAAVCVAGLTFCCLTGSLQLLEISWNLKSILEILEICWNLVGPPGNCFANEWQQS